VGWRCLGSRSKKTGPQTAKKLGESLIRSPNVGARRKKKVCDKGSLEIHSVTIRKRGREVHSRHFGVCSAKPTTYIRGKQMGTAQTIQRRESIYNIDSRPTEPKDRWSINSRTCKQRFRGELGFRNRSRGTHVGRESF